MAAGPYQVDEYNPGSDMTLVPNPTWFGDGPNIDEVTFRFISDVGNLPLALENGEVDVIYPQPQVDLVDQIAGLDGVASTITFGPTWEHITFNTATVPPEVRRAVALALDRELIVAALMRPFSDSAEPLGNRVYMNGQTQYQDNTPAEFRIRDVAAARAALEQGGWTAGDDGVYAMDGRRLSLRIRTTGGNPRREQFQELVQNQLGEAGIKITIDNLPGGEIFGPVFGSENDPPGPPGNFDLVIFAWVGGPLPASSTLQVFGTGSDSNPGAYVDEQVNDLLTEATFTLDLDQQAELLNQADTLMWQSLPSVPVYQLPFFLAWNDASTISRTIPPWRASPGTWRIGSSLNPPPSIQRYKVAGQCSGTQRASYLISIPVLFFATLVAFLLVATVDPSPNSECSCFLNPAALSRLLVSKSLSLGQAIDRALWKLGGRPVQR